MQISVQRQIFASVSVLLEKHLKKPKDHLEKANASEL
jgi:hypothetical protein